MWGLQCVARHRRAPGSAARGQCTNVNLDGSFVEGTALHVPLHTRFVTRVSRIGQDCLRTFLPRLVGYRHVPSI